MRFLVLIHDETDGSAGEPPAALLDAVGSFRAEAADGRWLDDGGLAPASDAVLVRADGGRTTVHDGPFAEAKEVIGGFFVVESPSPSAMARWTETFVGLHATHWPALSFTAEVRQIVDPPS